MVRMKQTIEFPDMVLNCNNTFRDELEITVRKNRVEFSALVDQGGNTFTCDKKKLLEVLKWQLTYQS